MICAPARVVSACKIVYNLTAVANICSLPTSHTFFPTRLSRVCLSTPPQAYIIALHQTMMDGYVGTEECIWAIIFKRLPHLFSP